MPPKVKKKVAKSFSHSVEKSISNVRYPPKQRNSTSPKLNMAFMSHDFADHPTTYLVKGVFAAHEASPDVAISVFSYGPDDSSKSRESIVDLLGDSSHGGSFYDIHGESHMEALKTICDRDPQVDIIFDMQGYTLGTRPELMANRCAKVQVNFLAFPGTSGASFIDYIVVDQYVASIERADEEFTEKLAILPRSYQANYFVDPISIPERGSLEWKALRHQENLSEPSFVFANLNKADKIDPHSFSVWMQCMQQVPESVLWLLEPSKSAAAEIVKKNLQIAARDAGISPDRIVFAKKVGREEHIRRMAAGDLFLDTLYYGAHTTATDAMRGGLPLLTLAGETFSGRVGVSLLHGMNSKKAASLVAYSVDEFVEIAVEMAKAQIDCPGEALGRKFIDMDDGDNHELFDWKAYSTDLDHLSRMMIEVKELTSKEMHVVLTK